MSEGKPREKWSSIPPPRDTLVDGIPQGALEAPASGGRIGTLVNERYAVESLLGSGAMASVFSAVDRATGAPIALKILHDRVAFNRDIVTRFLNEAKMMRAIAHPGIVEVVEAGHDESGRWFMAMEMLHGEDLAKALEAGPLPAKTVVDVGHQLLAALAQVHARSIVHRDVKPENVFLHRDRAGSLRVKLLDFGVAKQVGGKDAVMPMVTLEGVKIGTPHYMSPEQWAGRQLDQRSDVWAAGAVLFTAIVGHPPFDADDLGTLMTRITGHAAPSLATLRPEIGPAFVDTIDRALATDPARRWADARAFAAALHVGGARVDSLDWDE